MKKRAPLIVAGLVALTGLAAWWLVRSRDERVGDGVTATGAGATQAATAAGGAPTGAAGRTTTDNSKVTLAPEVAKGLLEFARKAWTTVPIRTDGLPRTKAIMRAIAGGAIDLKSATSRRSMRFTRTAYTQDVTSETPMFLGDRWGADGR